ncbi:MAG: response regulator [Thermoanaerobaculia bacterium]|nr:response regulator [Thermoanaerobaculia bacterium]
MGPKHDDGDSKPSVLFVDDDPDIRELSRKILTMNGFQVETASTGRDAITLARSLRPDLVMIDLGLPDIDGQEVAASLRETEGFSASIIAVTGRSESQLSPEMTARFDRIISKPVRFAELIPELGPLIDRT